MTTISELLISSTKKLKQKNNPSPRLDAEVLLAHLLGVDRVYFIIHGEQNLEQSTMDDYAVLVHKRLQGQPIAYIIGHQEFMGLDFIVNQDVLIPRPDTEILVEYVIHILKKQKREHFDVLDIGTGSGAIALSIGKFISNCKLTLVDISQKALNVARENAERLEIEDQVDVVLGDCFDGVKGHKYDIIVSNPPYIPSLDIEELQREVRVYEPRNALDGGEDGLMFYKRIVREAKTYLEKDGLLVFEIGYNQASDVVRLLEDNGYYDIETRKDFGGNDRVVAGKIK